MSLVARRASLAVAAVLDVALHARSVPVSSKAMAARLELGPRQLEGLLQALVRSGLLRGVRGPRGGYQLARERRRISVAEIVRAAERAGDRDDEAPRRLVAAVVIPAFAAAERAFLAELEAQDVEQLCAAAEAAGFDQDADPSDFTI